MILDEKVISAIQIFIGFGIAFLLAPTVWRERKNLDKRLVALWAISWCFGLGSFLNIDMGYMFVGQISHIPNLSLLLIYSLMATGLYSLVVLTSTTLRITPSEMRIFLYITVIFLISQALVFFLSGIAFSHPYLARNYANSIAELVYLNAIYVYQIALSVRPLVLVKKMFVSSRSLESRIRSVTMAVVGGAAMIYSFLRILYSRVEKVS